MTQQWKTLARQRDSSTLHPESCFLSQRSRAQECRRAVDDDGARRSASGARGDAPAAGRAADHPKPWLRRRPPARRLPHHRDGRETCYQTRIALIIGLMSLLKRAASMANTQRRLVPSPTDLNYAFLMENIHTYSLEDEIARWPAPPRLRPQRGPYTLHDRPLGFLFFVLEWFMLTLR